jgi:photosystem II stability/assembly factor-like uncharacterized protein
MHATLRQRSRSARAARRGHPGGRGSALLSLVLATLVLAAGPAAAQEVVPLPALLARTHVHGLDFDPAQPGRLWIATHHGFFVVGQDGGARLLSNHRDDLMGFTPHPTDAKRLYASGHPAGGGNLGVIVSDDGGRTWQPLSPGVGGPVDFHQLDISRADPNVLYGVYGTLQVSRDRGRTWHAVGERLDNALDLAASAREADTLYLATASGLRVSRDGGRTWTPAHPAREPATLASMQADGTLYAFVVGVGLLRAREPALEWEVLSNDFGKRALMHLAADPANPRRLVAATHVGELVTSQDGGRTWALLARPDRGR